MYDKEKPQRKTGKTVGYLGAGFAGMLMGRMLEPFVTQVQAISLIVILVEILLLLISFASPNVLRLYFAYKHDIVASVEGETPQRRLFVISPKRVLLSKH